jgi:hypothetical protein
LALELKFAADGLALVPLVRAAHKLDLLRSLRQAIRTAHSVDQVRQLLPPSLDVFRSQLAAAACFGATRLKRRRHAFGEPRTPLNAFS